MKRSGKMILLLLVAVALCGGYLAVQNLSQKETVAAEDVQISLLNAEADDVTGLSWETDGAAVTLKKQDGVWRMDGDDAFPVDQDAAQKLAQSVANLTANRRLSGVETLSDYGLEQPTFAVTVTLADGDWHLISQGALNALSGDAYVQVSGSEDVYIVSDAPADAFDLGREDLLAMESLPEIADAMQLELSTPERAQTLRYRAAGTDSYEDAETGRLMDADAVASFIDALNAINWTGCVSYSAGDAERTRFGLDEPTAEVRVRYAADADDGDAAENGDAAAASDDATASDDGAADTGEFVLLLGGTSSDDGSVYAATSADSAMIYTISSADAQAIYDAIDGGLESNRVFFADWDAATAVRVTAGGMQLTIARGAAEPAEADGADATAEPKANGVAATATAAASDAEATAGSENDEAEEPAATATAAASGATATAGSKNDEGEEPAATATAAASDAAATTGSEAEAEANGADALTEAEATGEADETDATAAEADATADSEATAAAEPSAWRVNGQPVDEELWSRLTDALDALESAEAETTQTGDAILTIEIDQDGGATQRAVFLDGVDSYAIQSEPRAVDAARIDEILRILRHLAK